MKVIISFFAVAILGACTSKPYHSDKDTVRIGDTLNSKYPDVIDSLKLHLLFDKAKWSLYCIYCDDSCTVRKRFGIKTITFGALDLKFSEIRQQHDTTEIDFFFYLDDTLRYDITTRENDQYVVSGVGFSGGSDSILYYITQTTLRYFWETNPSGRYANPLQPDVVDYIKKNSNRLHPWFKEEAIKRGVIK